MKSLWLRRAYRSQARALKDENDGLRGELEEARIIAAARQEYIDKIITKRSERQAVANVLERCKRALGHWMPSTRQDDLHLIADIEALLEEPT